MALFRHNRVEETTLPETTVYDTETGYDSSTGSRSWTAWALSFATLVVTVLVVVGLFYGGRWVYRKVTHKNKVATTQNQPAFLKPDEEEKSSDNSSHSSDQANDSSSNSSTNNSTSSNSSNSSSSSQTGTSSTSTSTPSSTSSTGAGKGATTDLTNTGPGDMLSVFAAVSVLAYIAHRRFLAKG